MGLFSPWFLAGVAAVGLPVYLHLLRRHKTTPQPFSSLMFFEQRTQSSIKHRRLRYLLLLALRLALLLLIVLAFANPYINRSVSASGGERLVLLAIDDSFSMRAGSRLADAKQQAINVLGARRPSDHAQVIALGSTVHQLTQPTIDAGELRAAVNSIKPGDSRVSLSELARAVRAMSESVKTPIELHLFTDLQKSAMPAGFAEMALPENTSLVLHPVVNKAEPNWTVESVSAPSMVWDTKKARVQATISGFDTPAATRTVSLVINGKTAATRSVEVPAGGRATAEFTSLEVPYGFAKCEVRIDSADSLAADDTALFAVERSDPQRVLFIHESRDSRSPVYFRTALASGTQSAFTLDTVTVDRAAGLQPGNYAFIVLSDVGTLPSAFEDALQKYVQGGGSVLVAAGPSTARRQRIPVSGEPIVESNYTSRTGERFLMTGDVDPSHPSVKDAARWAGVKFYWALRVQPGDDHVAAKLTDQTPLLLDKKIGEGRVLVLTSGLDNITNDFPLQPIFVPFIEQTARYLSGTENRDAFRLVDSFIELRTAKEQSINVEVIDPDGERPLSLEEASTAQSFQLPREGFYEVRRANGRHEMVAANVDRRESNLEIIPEDVLSLWRGGDSAGSQQASGGGAVRQESQPFSLWWYVMLFALIAAVAESVLASRYLGIEREAP